LGTSAGLEQLTTQNKHTNLPEGWHMVRFGDVVCNVDVSERDPLAKGIERYIGLDHIDPESLHIKRWGLIKDGTSFSRKFVTGQVLFGKRRAYQRKVAVTEFDGICSGDILVFKAKDDLLPELLPFIVQSNGFFEHALDTSAGSLSPRTKWKDLTTYEFPLPPKDEQKRIADILWSVDEAIYQYDTVLKNLEGLMRQSLTELITKGVGHTHYKLSVLGHIPENWDVVKLEDILVTCQYGLSMPLNNEGQFPIFRMMNIKEGIMVEEDMKFVDLSQDLFRAYKLEQGDILFNRTNSADLVGKVGIYRLNGNHVFASYLIRLSVRKDIVFPEYLNYYLNSDLGQRRILAYATPGVSQTNINASNLKRVLVPLPSMSEQTQIVTLLQRVEYSKISLQKNMLYLNKLKSSLLKRLLPH
jgi:type I restriction enzyme S subunit